MTRWRAGVAMVIALLGCDDPCGIGNACIDIDIQGDAKYARIETTWDIGPFEAPTAMAGPTVFDVTLPTRLRVPLDSAPGLSARRQLNLSLVPETDCALAAGERECTGGAAALLFNGDVSVDGWGGHPLSESENPSVTVRRLPVQPFAFRTILVEDLSNFYGALTTADLDRDGRAEIIVTYVQNQLGIFRYEEGSGFRQLGSPFVGLAPRAVAAADINGDGFVDIATANALSRDVTVLYGDGAGGTLMQGQFALPAGETWTPELLAIGNFDGQAPLDIVVTPRTDVVPAPASYRYVVFRGAGLTPVAADLGQASPGVPLIPDRLVAVDVASDALDDMLFLSDRSNRLQMRYGNPGLTQLLGEFWDAIGDGSPCDLSVVPLTGPGALDLVLRQCDEPHHVRTFSGHRFGVAAPISGVPNEIGRGLAIADWNGDGRLDLAVPAYLAPPRVQLFAGNGNGTFQPAVELPLSDLPSSATSADIDGDGRVDLIIGHDANLPPTLPVSLSPEPPRRVTVLRNLAPRATP